MSDEDDPVVDYDWATSRAAVRAMIARGWQPTGGLAVTPEGTTLQAMILRRSAATKTQVPAAEPERGSGRFVPA